MLTVDLLAVTKGCLGTFSESFGLRSASLKMTRQQALWMGLGWSLVALMHLVAGCSALRAGYTGWGLFALCVAGWILAGTTIGVANYVAANRG